VPDPTDIGHNRYPLATREMFEPEVKVVPRGAGKSRPELVLEANLVVILERLPHRWHQDVAAILHRQPPPDGNADDVFGEPSDEFDHERLSRKRRATWRR